MKMAKRYAIWDKQTDIITPVGEVLTPEQWIARRPIAGISSVTVVCSAGEINGGFFGTLGQMVQIWENQGADFSDCETDEARLERIEALEDEANHPSSDTVSSEELTATSLASIAASLEYQNLLTLDDEEV